MPGLLHSLQEYLKTFFLRLKEKEYGEEEEMPPHWIAFDFWLEDSKIKIDHAVGGVGVFWGRKMTGQPHPSLPPPV